ncbi:MAG TPA: endopeptidase, partial [Sorangium sp.]|nr:endopeptidase [Sorangium sp.]
LPQKTTATPARPGAADASRREPAARARPESPRPANARPESPRREEPRPEKEGRRAAPRAGERDALPLAAARAAAQQPMGGLDLSFLRPSAPSASQEEVEADSDGADASGALDDSGALKITD